MEIKEPTRDAILAAAKALAGVCDGAVAKDDMGYNAMDGPTVRSILRFQNPTVRQVRCLWSILGKYRRQLAGYGVDYDSLVPPPEPPPGPERGAPAANGNGAVRIAFAETAFGPRIAFSFPYDARAVEAIKGLKDGPKSPPWFDGATKTWLAPKEIGWLDRAEAAFRATGVAFGVDLDVTAWAGGIRQERSRTYEASRAESADIEVPTKLPLRQFQKAGVEFIEKMKGRALVGDDMGIGKTVQALGYLAKHPEALPALVICPANLRVNWYKEIRRFTDLKPLIIVSKSNLKGFRKLGLDVAAGPEPGYDVAILNYDLLEAETPYSWAKAFEAGDLSVEPFLLKAGRYALKALERAYEKSRDITAKARLLEVIRKIRDQGRASNRRKFVKTSVNGVPVESVMACGFKTLVCDEIHAIKDYRSQRAMAVHAMSKIAKNVIGLTGTPLLNRTSELWSQIHAINPEVFPDFVKYGMRYCGGRMEQVQVKGAPRGTTREVWDFSGATHLEELETVLRTRVMIRRTKGQVLKELPPKTRMTVPILLEPQELERLNRDCKAEMRELADLARERKEWKETLARMTGDERTRYLAEHAEEAARKNRLTNVAINTIEKVKQRIAAAKLRHCADFIVDAHEQQGKLLVFSFHYQTTDSLVAALSKAGHRVDFIDGRVEGAKRDPVKDRFQEGDLDILVCGIRAASEGLTLTASHTVAFVELDWTPGRHAQAEDRCHRISQANAVTIYYLIAVGTLEEKIAALIDAKREVANAALGEEERTLEEAGILDELLEGILKEAKGE